MHTLTLITGILCLLIVLFDAFQTIILPRRAVGRFRITRIFYGLTWRPWLLVARFINNERKRESVYSYYGPLSLIFLLVIWREASFWASRRSFTRLAVPFMTQCWCLAFALIST